MRLYTNARFVTMEFPGDTAAALLEEKGRILRLYRREEDIPAGISAPRIDLEGAYVYPGFVDTHTHAFEGGLYSLCVDLGGAVDLSDLLERLRAAESLGGVLIAWNLDVHGLAEGRFPTREELDAAVPETPLLIRRIDGHSSVVNSAAAARISWPGGVAPREYPLTRDYNRAATGWFHAAVDDDGVRAAYRAAGRLAAAGGLTGLHAMVGDGEADPRHYRLIAGSDEDFGVDLTLYPQIRDIPTALELGSPRVGGCLLADGSIGSHTAALTGPYRDRPDSSGELYRDDESWYRFFAEAHAHGLAGCVHAIGSAAVGQIVRVLMRVYAEDPRPIRHQIIHCEMVDDETLSRLSELPAAAVMQPAFDAFWGGPDGLYAERLGDARKLCNRLASLHAAGVLVTGSSDWYITPLDALGGMRAACGISVPGESLDAFEAAALFTRNAAQLTGRADREGMLKAGFAAAATLFSGDPRDPETAVFGVLRNGVLLRP